MGVLSVGVLSVGALSVCALSVGALSSGAPFPHCHESGKALLVVALSVGALLVAALSVAALSVALFMGGALYMAATTFLAEHPSMGHLQWATRVPYRLLKH